MKRLALLLSFLAAPLFGQSPTCKTVTSTGKAVITCTIVTPAAVHDTVIKHDTVFKHDTVAPPVTQAPPPVTVPVVTPPVVVPPSGGFATPDVLNTSFESGWDGWSNGAGGSPTGVTRVTTLSADGAYSVQRTWTPSSGDLGTGFIYDFPKGVDRVWVRFSFRVTAPITSIMKFMRFDSPGRNSHLGGFFLSDVITFSTDQENGAAGSQIGLTASQIFDGKWHSIELEYWRNGDPSGFPSAAFWFDGVAVSMPDGYAGVQYAPSQNAMRWKGGRVIVGQRGSSDQLGAIEFLATLNGGNSTTGQINVDRFAISTKGRIGP